MHEERKVACGNEEIQYLADEFVREFRGDRNFLLDLYAVWNLAAKNSPQTLSREKKLLWEKVDNLSKKLLRALIAAPLLTDEPEVIWEYSAICEAVRDSRLLASGYLGRLGTGPQDETYHSIWWISALLPYFRFVVPGKSPWPWLADWLREVLQNESRRSAQRDDKTLENWWHSRVVVSYTKKYSSQKKREKLSSADSPFQASLAYEDWKEWAPNSEQGLQFRACILKELPFMKKAGYIAAYPPLPISAKRKKRKRTRWPRVGIFGMLRWTDMKPRARNATWQL